MKSFRDRLAWDAKNGAIYDRNIPYLLIRPDSLMGIFEFLLETERVAAFEAFARSIAHYGKGSADSYQTLGAGQADALQAGALGGVGLDVFPNEPLAATEPLLETVRRHEDWARDRVALTPHVGGVSPQSLEELRRRAVETARDFLIDGTLVNRIA